MTQFFNKLFLILLPTFFFLQSLSAQDNVIIAISSDTVAVGDTFCLTVSVRNFVQIVGLQVALNWDGQALEFIKADTSGITAMEETQYGINYLPLLNRMIWAWEDTDVFQDGTTVPDGTSALTLCFRALKADVKTMVVCNAAGMPPTSPAAIDNYQGVNLFNSSTNIAGTVCITGATSAATVLDQAAFAIYPNPFYRALYLQGAPDAVGKIRILNATGMAVFTSEHSRTGEKIALPDLATGIYFVEWVQADEHRVSRKMLHIRE